jgi:16S rRNA (cytidine1402-2'-O)-methyltransferase
MTTNAVAGVLYLVSTPIGNLGDITLRALEVLRGASAILAEDTRHTRGLLQRYEISTPMEPYHEHNEARATPGLLERLRNGASLALVSDAGTPLLSDPGERLVRGAIECGINVVAIPGASAMLAALVSSGLAVAPFLFVGFLPRKGTQRKKLIAEMTESAHTCVLYESPARVAATLAEISNADAASRSRAAVVARELTKHFEEIRRGTVDELVRYYKDSEVRGEVVIVLAGREEVAPSDAILRERAATLRAEGVTAREIVRVLTEEFGASRNAAYRLAHES